MYLYIIKVHISTTQFKKWSLTLLKSSLYTLHYPFFSTHPRRNPSQSGVCYTHGPYHLFSLFPPSGAVASNRTLCDDGNGPYLHCPIR